jgi:hypothetical protein
LSQTLLAIIVELCSISGCISSSCSFLSQLLMYLMRSIFRLSESPLKIQQLALMGLILPI